MRHGKKFNHLGRTAPHRKAMLSNMAASLILHKRINTTVAKAKALRTYIEPLLTRAKDNTTHNRKIVFSYLQQTYFKFDGRSNNNPDKIKNKDKNRFAVQELFDVVAPKIQNRNGGYTRIIKTGFRAGDGADMAMIELVDFNDIYNPIKEAKKTTRRSRRSSAKKEETPNKEVENSKLPIVEEEDLPTVENQKENSENLPAEDNKENKKESED